MKAPPFWYQPPGAKAALLEPLTLLWRTGSALRRSLASPIASTCPMLCIGNIVAGGAGKTPVALAIADILKVLGQKPVFVARGYLGKEPGPIKVDLGRHDAADVGDEALLLARRAPVWIGRDRKSAVREAQREATHIILDDGFQNPHLRPDHSLLVVEGATGFGNGHLIPAGPLRESARNAFGRASAVILIGDSDIQDVAGLAKSFAKPLLRATVKAALGLEFPRGDRFFAFAGIGRPEKFFASCREEKLDLIGTQSFADHHMFTAAECEALVQASSLHGARLLTTEKDWVRLAPEFRPKVAVLPIKLEFEDQSLLTPFLNLPQ